MVSRIYHYIFPYQHNNFRAKLRHHSRLFLIIGMFSLLTFTTTVIHHAQPQVLGVSYSISTQELVSLTNKVRLEHHLQPLVPSAQLTQAATATAGNMFQKNYWSHFAPDGTSPWFYIKQAGYTYEYAGENLAKGFTDSQSIITAWMKSPSHRENVLSPNYHDVGFAVSEGRLVGEDTVLVVEEFGETPTEYVATKNAPPQTNEITNNNDTENVLAEAKKSDILSLPTLDIRVATRAITFVILLTLTSVLILDLFIVEQKKIPRIVGHNLDHIILITLFLVFIFLQHNGGIL